MRTIYTVLFLWIFSSCFAQKPERTDYHKIEPFWWYKNGEGDIVRYMHNDVILEIYDNHREAIKITFAGNILMDWTVLDSNPYATVYYNDEANSYFAFAEVDSGDYFRYTIYFITPKKAEYLGIFEPDHELARQYRKSDSFKNMDWCMENYIAVYTVDGKLNVVETTPDGEEVLVYTCVDPEPYPPYPYKEDIEKFDSATPFPEPLYFENTLDLDSDRTWEKYGIDWDRKQIFYLDEAAVELRHSEGKSSHMHFQNDTLVITDYGKLPEAANNAAYSASFYFHKRDGDQQPLLFRTNYDVREGSSKFSPFKISCSTEKSALEGFSSVGISEIPEYNLQQLVNFSACYADSYKQLPTIYQCDLSNLLESEPVTNKTLKSYRKIAENLLQITPEMEEMMGEIYFGPVECLHCGIGAAIYLNEKILEKFPDDAEAYLGIGDGNWLLSAHDEALQAYNSYISLVKKENESAVIPQHVLDRINDTNANKR